MRIHSFFLALGLGGLALLSACGTRPINGGGTTGGNTAPLTLALTAPFTLGTSNNPPAGITVLSFEITITSAVLQPGNVSLIDSPQTIELTQLQTDSVLLTSKTVATGNYTSLVLTFANPDMTIYNGAGSVANCTVGTVCEFGPTLSVSSVTLSPALTLTANTPEALGLVLSLNDSLQPDLSLNLGAGLTFESFTSVSSSVELFPLNTVAGVIAALGTNQITLNTTAGASLSVATTSSTQYSFPSTVCAANDSSCLAIGQVVSADMSVFGDGSIQANTVTFEDNSGDPILAGTIVAIASGSNPPQFSFVVHGQAPATAGVSIDNFATVSLQTPTTYLIDADDLTIPAGYAFASTADLVVGQEVLVRGNTIQATPVNNAPDTIAISTNQLILRQSQWTANVGLPDAGTGAFSLTSLPNLFTSLTPTAINNLFVSTPSQTQFVFTSSTTLTAGTSATVKGLIFSNTSNTVGSPSDVASIVQGAPNLN